MSRNSLTRRRFGFGIATLAPISVAGCIGDGDEGTDEHERDDHDDHNDGNDDRDHHSDDPVSGVDVVDRGEDEVVANYHGHWHGELPAIHRGEHLSLGARFEDADGDELPIGSGEAYLVDADVSGPDDDIVRIESHGDHVHLHGEAEGEVHVTFQLVSNDTVEWETSEGIGVEVVDE